MTKNQSQTKKTYQNNMEIGTRVRLLPDVVKELNAGINSGDKHEEYTAVIVDKNDSLDLLVQIEQEGVLTYPRRVDDGHHNYLDVNADEIEIIC